MARLRVVPAGSNMTELHTGDANILFSYQTPVAAHVYGRGWLMTRAFYSVTTSRHINRWIPDGVGVEKVDQREIEGLVS